MGPQLLRKIANVLAVSLLLSPVVLAACTGSEASRLVITQSTDAPAGADHKGHVSPGVFTGITLSIRNTGAGAAREANTLKALFNDDQHAFRREDHPHLPRLIEFQLGVPRQHWPARFTDPDVAACHRFASVCFRHERARRDVAVDIGMIQRVELNP